MSRRKRSVSRRKRSVSEKDASLAAHLAEYAALRAEVIARFDWQRQAFAYLATLATAGVALISAKDRINLAPSDVGELSVLVPLITVPLAVIFFDNELMIWGIYNYLSKHLRVDVAQRIANSDVLRLEQKRFSDMTWGRTIRCSHRALSWTRWVFFLVPTAGPIAYAMVHLPDWWDASHSYSSIIWIYRVLFVVDLVLLAILLLGIVVSIYARSEVWDVPIEVRVTGNTSRWVVVRVAILSWVSRQQIISTAQVPPSLARDVLGLWEFGPPPLSRSGSYLKSSRPEGPAMPAPSEVHVRRGWVWAAGDVAGPVVRRAW